MKRELPRELPRDRRFTLTLCGKAADRASGIVTVSRGKLRRLFCLQEGRLVFATSNLLEEQFPEYLVRTGVLSPATRLAAVEAAARTNRKPGQLLLEGGQPPQGELRRAMEGLVQELFSSALEWPDGQTSFESGQPHLEGEVTVRIDPRSLVFAHVRRYPATIDALRVRIGPPDLRPVATTGPPAGLELDAVGDFLLARCDGETDLAALIDDAPAPEERTLRAVYALLLTGLLEPEDSAMRRARQSGASETPLTREECLGRLAVSAGNDHYVVLGIDKQARREQVRDAYYALARRYHPDRFRSGPLNDLLPRFEEFFTRVTAAYNTLMDSDQRAEFDQGQLAPASDAAKGPDTGYLARQNFLRGRALAAHRKFTEAVTFLENAIQLDPGHADYHLELGLVLSGNPRHREEAERHLLEAVTLAPSLVRGYLTLGHMYRRACRPAPAARMAREALRWEPGLGDAVTLLAEAGNVQDERDDGAIRAIFSRS